MTISNQTPQNTQAPQAKPLQLMIFVWGSFVFAHIMMTVVAMTQHPFSPATLLSDLGKNPVAIVFVLLALMNIAISFVLTKLMIKKAALPTMVLGQERDEKDLARIAFVPFILRCAFLEAATMFGLVMSIFILNSAAVFLTMLLAIALHVTSFPNTKFLRNFVK